MFAGFDMQPTIFQPLRGHIRIFEDFECGIWQHINVVTTHEIDSDKGKLYLIRLFATFTTPKER